MARIVECHGDKSACLQPSETTQHRNLVAKALWILCALLALSSCATTEELYAEYDAANCIVELSDDGVVQVTQTDTDTHMRWEPAVYFDFDSAALQADQMRLLDTSIELLKRYPSFTVGLHGFTDSQGNSGYNRRLANRRVESVSNYLKANGMLAIRLIPLPAGEIPRYLGLDSAAGMASNRRVELVLMDHQGKPLTLELAFDK